MTLFWMSGPNQISNQPGSRVDSQHKRLHHIRSERPGTGHQLAERPAERDIAHSLPSSNNTWSSTSSSSLKKEQKARIGFQGQEGGFQGNPGQLWFTGSGRGCRRQSCRAQVVVIQQQPVALAVHFSAPRSLCTQPSLLAPHF